MRFYALVAAFAAVLISHEANAQSSADKLMKMDISISKILKSLEQYRENHTKLLEEAIKSPEEMQFDTKRFRDILKIYKRKGVEGVNLDTCRIKLKEDISKYLSCYQRGINRCPLKIWMSGDVDATISRLKIDAANLRNDLLYVIACERSNNVKYRDSCADRSPNFEQVQVGFKEWNNEVRQLIANQHQSNKEEEQQMIECHYSAYQTFQNKLVLLENLVRQVYPGERGSRYLTCQ